MNQLTWAALAALAMTGAQALGQDGLPGQPVLPGARASQQLEGRLVYDADYWPHWKVVGARGGSTWVRPGAEPLEQLLPRLPRFLQILPKRGDTLSGLADTYDVTTEELLQLNPGGLSPAHALQIPGCWVRLEGRRVDNTFHAVGLTNLGQPVDFQAKQGGQPGAGRWLHRAGLLAPLPSSGGDSLPAPQPGEWLTYRGRALRGPHDASLHLLIEAVQAEVQTGSSPQAEPQRASRLAGAADAIGRLFSGSGEGEVRASPFPAVEEGQLIWITAIQDGFARVRDAGWVPVTTLSYGGR